MASRTPKEVARGIPHLLIASESNQNETDGSTRGEATPPGDILTEPTEVVFTAPFIDKYNFPFRITNDGSRPVGWAIKTNCPTCISADPPCGMLDPKGKTILYITCEPFNYQGTDVSADRITIEWVLTPENAGKQFKREWFQGDVIKRRKNVPINYNF